MDHGKLIRIAASRYNFQEKYNVCALELYETLKRLECKTLECQHDNLEAYLIVRMRKACQTYLKKEKKAKNVPKVSKKYQRFIKIETVEELQKIVQDKLDAQIINLRAAGYTDEEIGVQTGSSTSSIHQRRTILWQRYQSIKRQ